MKKILPKSQPEEEKTAKKNTPCHVFKRVCHQKRLVGNGSEKRVVDAVSKFFMEVTHGRTLKPTRLRDCILPTVRG